MRPGHCCWLLLLGGLPLRGWSGLFGLSKAAAEAAAAVVVGVPAGLGKAVDRLLAEGPVCTPICPTPLPRLTLLRVTPPVGGSGQKGSTPSPCSSSCTMPR
ncbi:hypothetical protein V8C86DRAFT_2676260 [Haematococcus lacustris]